MYKGSVGLKTHHQAHFYDKDIADVYCQPFEKYWDTECIITIVMLCQTAYIFVRRKKDLLSTLNLNKSLFVNAIPNCVTSTVRHLLGACSH